MSAVQKFGKYQIVERVATGGMAEIYKARLEGIGGFQRTFAIKRILPHLSENQEYVAMLVDEAKVAGLLSHANIVQILDLGQVESVWYIAMEYVEGCDLGALLERAKERGLRLPVPHAVFIAVELLKGLEYAHQRQVVRGGRTVPLNIIHRDISPPNVLLSFQGEVKLTDFGIARASHKALDTKSGIIKGRVDYMSPEQAAGDADLDQRSDVFSAGVLLYEMLAGTHPFRGAGDAITLQRIREGTYAPLSTVDTDVPEALEAIVTRALQTQRDDRYATSTELKEDLDNFFHDAGFIFTQSTLAQYIRGLFPPPARENPVETFDSGPVRRREDLLEELELEFDVDPPSSAPHIPEESTLISPALQHSQQLRPTAPKDPTPVVAFEGDEQETVILHSPATGTPPPAREAASPTPEPAPAPAPRSGASGLQVTFLAAFALLIGLIGGFAGGLSLQGLLGWTQDQVTTLTIDAPEGARSYVNGTEVFDTVSLEPNAPYQVIVEVPGQAPKVRILAVQAGERARLLVDAAPEPAPSPPSPPPEPVDPPR